MGSRPTRALAFVVGAGVVLWLARLKAHAKVPPPEGRWREVTSDAFE
ncbi:MAG: hypothetical protein M3174_05725 [Actinomycetota bacterium]|nr:hypothetical protein [Actinomycetota bacterium]